MKTFKLGLLGATAFAAMAAASSAQADQIGFAPGQAIGGTAVNNIDSSDAADLNDHRIVDVFNWRSVNDTILPGAPFTAADQWFIRVDHGGDGTADSGDSFTESFTFNLITTTPKGTIGNEPNPLDNNVYGEVGDGIELDDGTFANEPTHVFMQLSASGKLTGDFDGSTASLKLAYEFAFFTMVFDEDADPQTTDDQTIIARFGDDGCDPGKCFGIATAADIATLEWEVAWDAALAGVFEIDGNEVATGPDAGDGLNEVSKKSFKITRQAVQVAGFDVDEEPDTLRIRLDADSEATATTEINTIPEPMTLGLLGAGLVGLGAVARRRRSA